MKPKSKRQAALRIVPIVLTLGIISFLVAVGGTDSIAVHFYYIPIIYAGFVFGDIGAIVTALAAALVCGPWMPAAYVIEGAETRAVAQSAWDIALRTAIFYVMGIFASRVSATIERRANEMQTLYEVARTVSSSLRLREVLDTIARQAVSALDARACSIRLLDADSGELEPAASAGLSEQYWTKGPVTVTESALDRRVMDGEIVQTRDAQTDPEWQYPDAARSEGLTSVLTLPLQARDSILGVIRIYAHRKRVFSEDEIDLLRAFAHNAAVAIENAELYEESRRGYFETVRALTIAIEARDSATYSHSERVTDLADALAVELGRSEQERELLRFGCILHDIGKIGIEERMLDARETSEAEHVFYRMHPLIGRSILRPVSFAQEFLPIVVHHHERWDGRGFPEALEGEGIPYLARLVAVVDSYERAVNPTESPMPISPEEALRSILRGAGTAYDPEIVAAFATMMRRKMEEGTLPAAVDVQVQKPLDIEAIIEEALNGALADAEPAEESEEQ
ncbi:MAG: HD domain-containing protein [candidate division WS1 bacterium]|nr:HD domain-containing protein [candidate division WS1 bacterium]